MSAEIESVQRSQLRTGSEDDTRAWLDKLVNGSCSPAEFLEVVDEQLEEDRDEGWEILSLLDQYYRRGKIKVELFHVLKSRIEGSAINGNEGAAASAAANERVQKPSTPAAPQIVAHAPPVTVPAAMAAHAPPVTAPTGIRAQPSMAAPVATPTAVAPPVTAPTQVASTAVAAQKQPAQPAVREVAVGDVLRNRYRVRGLLGHGGMGTVFDAIDEYRLNLPVTGRRIALKVLHTTVAHREELLSELQLEFQHLQLLSHPNIVRVHEFDRDGDIAFFTMELLDGALLSRVLNARNSAAFPKPYALAIMRGVGAALAHAHSRGVVHGDINPQNIFITNEGELRVLDFGASHKVPGDKRTADDNLLQRTPVATPGYASCQLLLGQHPDARDDVFAFSCVAYLLLAGRHPFPNRTALEARTQNVNLTRPPGLSGHQWRVLREGLRWERDRRPADIQEWLTRFDLSGAATQLPPLPVLANAVAPRRHKIIRAVAVGMLVGLLAGGGYWAAMHDELLEQQITEWRDKGKALFSDSSELPAPLPPVNAQPAQQPPTKKTVTHLASPVTESVATTAPAATATPPAATTMPSAPVAAPTPPPMIPATTQSSRGAVVTQQSAGDSVAHAANIRIELAADTVEVPATETTALVIVHRKGSQRGSASFTWWTESGTAKPGHDFKPVMPRVEQIENGSNSVALSIPVSGARRTQPKSFYVVIDRTEDGPSLGARTLTMVTLQPQD